MDTKKKLTKSLNKKISKKMLFLVSVLGIVVVCSGFEMAYHSWCSESTDDAQIDGNIIPLRTTVTGYISEIRFIDNQKVKKNDTLVVFDTVSLKALVAQAEAQVLAAQAELQSNRKQISASEFSEIAANFTKCSAKENISVAKAHEWQARQEYQRIEKMFKEGAATQQTLDNAKTSYQVTSAQLGASCRQFDALKAQESTTHSQTNIHHIQVKLAMAHIKEAQAQLALADDQYKHAFITAPCDGTISRKNIQIGQFVSSGTALASLISLSDIWITANFKETQLNNMVAGQTAEIKIDAYSGLRLTGKVESFCGATGSKFSILPAENATGNFIKVTQRVPVRICINNKNCKKLLIPGMSAVVSVKTK
ncbi:MAG: HlyD family secretion protein [Bacteroidaceae bacterium]|nr:HlyD family secretion protein [Bacteroidaceae bacterium]